VQATVNDKNAADYRVAMREAKAAALAKAEPPKPAQPAKPQAKPETFVLGGGDFLLSVKFTTLGAGVQQLIVNPIPGVNKMGLADKEADGAVKPLELIPEDDKAPSFTIYHYATAVETPSEERPLDTLGTRTWTVGDRKNGADEQSISFNTELPESGVRLIKTYTLRPREFHVGLTVRIERLPDAKEKAPFRYQSVGWTTRAASNASSMTCDHWPITAGATAIGAAIERFSMRPLPSSISSRRLSRTMTSRIHAASSLHAARLNLDPTRRNHFWTMSRFARSPSRSIPSRASRSNTSICSITGRSKSDS
jgi:hypothetical protein